MKEYYKKDFFEKNYIFRFPENLNFSDKTECFRIEVLNHFS